MGARGIANKLTDLLPEVLIEAQRCDRITAEAALRRTVEDLAYNHGFFRVWIHRSYDEKTERVNDGRFGTSGRVFYMDEMSVLRIIGGMIDGRPYCGTLALEDGRIFAFGETWKSGGGKVAFHVNAMPQLDESFLDPTLLTRDRNVIISGTLADLFSMPGKAWANETRAVLWRDRFTDSLSSWKTRETLGFDGAGPFMRVNPFGWL